MRDPLAQSVSIFFDLATLVASPANKWGAVLLNRSTYEVIGRAAHDGTKWVFGDLDLTKVSTTPYATVASVDDGTTLTLTGGHNLTTGTVRLWDTSAGASFGDVAGTVVGDTLTVPDTTGMAAGDQVWRTGVSELVVGGGEFADPSANGVVRFLSGVRVTGTLTYGLDPQRRVATAVGTETFETLHAATGLALGPELLTDPDMTAAGTADWTPYAGATVAKDPTVTWDGHQTLKIVSTDPVQRGSAIAAAASGSAMYLRQMTALAGAGQMYVNYATPSNTLGSGLWNGADTPRWTYNAMTGFRFSITPHIAVGVYSCWVGAASCKRALG